MKTQIISTEITKENKKILKNADTVCFRLLENGQSQLELYKKLNIDGFQTEVRETIQVNTRLSNYEKGYDILKAFNSNHFAQDCGVWQTIVKNLKIGDKIRLEWLCGNNTNQLESLELSCDQLFLIIEREKGNLKFMVDSQVTYKNNVARMINIIPSKNKY